MYWNLKCRRNLSSTLTSNLQCLITIITPDIPDLKGLFVCISMYMIHFIHYWANILSWVFHTGFLKICTQSDFYFIWVVNCQSSAYWRIGLSTSNCIQYFAPPRVIILVLVQLFNSVPPSAAYMRQWIWSALVQIMACRLYGAKPLSNPMLGYCQLDP